MFDTIAHWLSTVPLQDPLRALVIIVLMLTFSASLYGLWEILFVIATKFRGPSSNTN